MPIELAPVTDPNKDIKIAPRTKGVLPAPSQLPTDSPRLSTNYIADSNLENYMASNQSRWELLAKATGGIMSEAVLGTVEAGSYLFDFEQMVDKLKGSEEEYTNWLADAMKQAKGTVSNDLLKVHQTNEAQTGFAPGDATWWAKNSPQTIGTALSLMIPAAGIAGAVGKVAKLAKATEATGNLAKGLAATVASRYAESTMEANGVYERAYNQLLSTGVSEPEARQRAGEQASNAWNTNWVFAAQDFLQYSSILKGFSSLAKGKKGFSIGELAKQATSEAGEEAGQYVVAEEAYKAAIDTHTDYFGEGFGKRLSDYVDDPEFKASTLLGAVGGGVFAGAAPLAQSVASKGAELTTYLGDQVKKLTNKGLAKERANYTGDTATAQAIDEATFAQQLTNHLEKGTLSSLKQDYENLQKEADLAPETREFLKHKTEDIDFIQNEQARLKNSDIPASLHKQVLFTGLEQRNQSRMADMLEGEMNKLYGEIIKEKQLPQDLIDIKKIQISLNGYAKLAGTNPQFVPKVQQLATALKEKTMMVATLYPGQTVDQVLATNKDQQLSLKAFQLASTLEKMSNLKKDIASLTTKEGITNAKKQAEEKKLSVQADQLIANPKATKQELEDFRKKTTNPEVQAKLSARIDSINQAEKSKNEADTKDIVHQPDLIAPPVEHTPDYVDLPPEMDSGFEIPAPEFDPNTTLITDEYGGLTFNQAKHIFGIEEANSLLEKLQSETKPETLPPTQEAQKADIKAQVASREVNTVTTWLKVRPGKWINGNFQPSEGRQKYYDNTTNKEVDVTDVFATDSHGHILIDTPIIQVRQEITLKLVDNGTTLSYPYTLTPGFKPNKIDNFVINGYTDNVEKPLFQLPSGDNPNIPNQGLLRELRQKVIDSPNGFVTRITSKSIGDFRMSSSLKSLEVLAFDFDPNNNYTKLPHNPILFVAGFNNILSAPNVANMRGMDKATLDQVEAVLQLPRPNDISPGAVFTPRTTPDGSKRLALLEPRKLTEVEAKWVQDNLGKLLSSNDTAQLSEVLHVPLHFASFLTGTQKKKTPDVVKASRRRMHLVQTTDTNTELLIPVKNKAAGWIVLPSTGDRAQVQNFLDRKPFKFDIIDEKGVRLQFTGDSAALKPETLKNIYDSFESLLNNSFRNVKDTNVNSEFQYTDPVTNQTYDTYYDFVVATDAIQTDLPGSKTMGSGEDSSYSFENAGLHLDPQAEQVQIIIKDNEITHIDSYNTPSSLQEVKKNKVILTLGTSGSGKTTWIKSLPKDKYTVISPDEMRLEFTGSIDDKSKDREIYEEVKKRTIDAVNKHNDVIIDSTNLQKERRRDFINVVKSAVPNVSLEYKLMPLDPELAKERIKAQVKKGENRANVPDSTIDRHSTLYKEMLEDIKEEPLIEFNENPPGEDPIEEYYGYEGKTRPALSEGFKVITEKELTWFKDTIGEEFLQITKGVDRVIANGGIEAFGLYHNALVTVADLSETGTIYHEAFHFALENTILPSRRDRILKDISEEELAEDFRLYMLSNGVHKPKVKEAKGFFEKLLNFIRNLIGLKSPIERLFKDIASTQLTPEERAAIKTKSFYSEPKYRLLPGFRKYRQQEDAVLATAYEVISLARAAALQNGLEFTDLLTNKKNVDAYFEAVRQKFGEDQRRLAAKPVSERTLEDRVRVENYKAMGVFGDTWEDKPSDLGPVQGFKSEVLRSFAKFGFRVKLENGDLFELNEVEESNVENEYAELKEQDEAERIHDIDHTLISPAKGLSTRIKLFLSTIPEPNVKDGKVSGIKQTIFGTPKYIDFNRVYSNLNDKLANSEIPLTKLEELAKGDPISQVVFERLSEEIKQGNTKLQNEFNTKFNLTTYIYTTSLHGFDIGKGYYARTIETNRSSIRRVILSSWRQESVRKSFIDNDGTPVAGKATALNKKVDNFAKKYKEGRQDKNPIPYEQVKDEFVSVLKEIGVTMPKQVWDDLNTKAPGIKARTLEYWFFGLNSSSLQNLLKLATEGVNPYDQRTILDTLAEKSKNYMDNLRGSQFLNEFNNQVYATNTPSYLTEFIGKIKANNTELVDTLAQDSFYTNNQFLGAIKNNDARERLTLEFISADRSSDNDPKDFEARSPLDSTIARLNYYYNNASSLTAKYFVGTFSDKTKQAVIGLPKHNTTTTAYNFLFTVLKNTVNQEAQRIQKVRKYVGMAELQAYPRGEQFTYIPKLNEISGLADSLFDGQTNPEKYKEVSKRRDETIKSFIKEEYERFVEAIINNGTISRNKAGQLENANIPLAIVGGKDLNSILQEFFYNDLAWRTETSKVLMGDAALYKSDTDYYKRQYQLVTPGVKPFNNPEAPVSLTRAIFSKVIKVNSDEYLQSLVNLGVDKNIADQYRIINKTDAQSLTTVHAYRKMAEAEGSWTKEQEQLYQLAWKDNLSINEATKRKPLDPVEVAKLKSVAARTALQPLKPFQYNDRVITYPDGSKSVIKEQFKDSISVLIPDFANRHTEYKKLLGYMVQHKVDIMSAEDTVKVGLYGVLPNDLSQTPTKANLRQVSISDIRFPQTVPDSKKEVISGTQFNKKITSNIELDGSYQVGNRSVKGKALIQEWNTLWEEKISKDSEGLRKDLGLGTDFNISEDPKVRTTQLFKIKTLLDQELLARELNENFSDALDLVKRTRDLVEFTLHLGFPTHAKRFSTVLTNIFKKNILKQKSPGFAMVNLADYGTSIERSSNLNFITNDEGGFAEAEIGLPIDFFKEIGLNYIEDVDPVTNKIRWNRLSEAQKDALQMIAYRIPTSDKSSMLPVRVAMVLPASVGNVVMIPGELTIQQGLDFDVDKTQLLRRVLKDGKPDKDNTSNKLFNIAWAVLTSKYHINEMLKPLGSSTLKAIKESYGIKDQGFSSLASATTDLLAEEKNKHAKRMIGIFSRFSTGHDLIQTILDYVYVSPNTEINISSPNYKYNQLGRKVDDQGKLISGNISEDQSAALDAAKDPILADLNVTTVTAPLKGYMTLMGVNMKTVSDFMMQPILREWMRMFNIQGANSQDKALAALLEAYPQVDTLYQSLNRESRSRVQLDAQDLAKSVNSTVDSNPEQQAQVLFDFVRYMKVANLMGKINNVLSIDTHQDLSGVEALQSVLNQIEEVTNVDNPIYLDKALFDLKIAPKEARRLASFYKYGIQDALEFSKQFFPYGNSSYKNVQDYIAASIGIPTLTDKNLLSTVNTFVDYYMMEANGKIAPVLNKVSPNYIQRWSFLSIDRSLWLHIQDLLEYNPGLKDNALIQSLEVYPSRQEGVQMIGVANTNKNANKTRMTQGWWDLLTSANESLRTLGADLIRFAIYTSGFGYNTRSFIDLVPVQFWVQNGLAEEHRILLAGLLPNESGESATRIDAEGATRNFVRHNFMSLKDFPEVYWTKTKTQVKTKLINTKVVEDTHVVSFSIPKEHPLNSTSRGRILPAYVRLWDQADNKYRLYESNPQDKLFFKEVQPLGEPRSFFEVTYTGRKVSLHPNNQNSGSPAPFEQGTKKFPLLGEEGNNPYIKNYIEGEKASPEEVLKKILVAEGTIEGKADVQALLRNVSKINTNIEVTPLEGQLGLFEVKDKASTIKINPNGNVESDSDMRTVLLHELNHAYSVGVLANPTTENEINFVRNVERLRSEVIEKAGKIKGTEDKFEFIATVASDRSFRNVLKKYSLWERLLRGLRKLLGLRDSFDKVLDQYYAILDSTEDLQRVSSGEFALLQEEKKRTPAQRKRINLLEQMISSLKSREDRLRKQGKKIEANQTGKNIDILNELAKNKKSQALVRYLLIVDEEVKQLKKSYSLMAANPEKINPDTLWHVIEQLVSYDLLNSLSNELRLAPEVYAPSKEASEVLLKQFEALRSEVSILTQDVKKLRIKRAAAVIKSKTTDPSLTLEGIIDQLEIADRDISWTSRNFDAGIDTPDIGVQTVHRMIKEAEAQADRLTNNDLYNQQPEKKQVVYKTLTEAINQYGETMMNEDGSTKMFWKPSGFEYTSIGLNKALNEYEAMLTSQGKSIGSVADKFAAILNTKTLTNNDNGVEFVDPKSTEGKAILSIKKGDKNYPLRQFYETVVFGYLRSQETIKQPSLRPGLRIPSIQRGVIEALTTEGLSGLGVLKERALDAIRRKYDETDFRAVDENGKPLDYLPIRFIAKQDGKDGRINTRGVSLDVATTVGVFMNEMHRYAEMEKILADMELIKSQLEDRKVVNSKKRIDHPGIASFLTRDKTATSDPETGLVQTKKGAESNSFLAVETMMRRLAYGQYKQDAGEAKVLGVRFDIRKTVDSILKFTGMRILLGNIAIPLTNLAVGELTMLKEAVGGNVITMSQWKDGQKFSALVAGQAFSDLGRREKKTKFGRVFTYFNPMDNLRPVNDLGVDTNWMRTILPKISRSMGDTTEFKLASTTLGAVFSKFKAKDANNREVSLYDALKVEMDGSIGLEKGYSYKGKKSLSNDDVNEIRDYTLRLYQLMNGNYNKIDSPGVKESILGDLVLFMRNWLVPGFNTRWQLKRYDERFKKEIEGHYISALVTFNNFFNPTNGYLKGTVDALRVLTWMGVADPETLLHPNELDLPQEQKDSLIEMRKAGIRKTLVELYLIAGISLIMLSAWAEDDDDSYALYMLARVRRELLTFVSPTTAWDVLRSPSVAMRTVEDFGKVTYHGVNALGALATGEDLDRYKSGPGKGEIKLLHDLKPILALDQLEDLDRKTRIISRGYR